MRAAATKLAAHDALHPSKTEYPNDAKGAEWHTVKASDWVSGFYPGALWYLYEYARDEGWQDAEAWRKRAEGWTAGLSDQQFNSGTNDTGFMIFNSYGNGYRLTKNADYPPVIRNAARSLSARFLKSTGLIRSWGGITDWRKSITIMDNMMNLELLVWAAKNGGEAYNGTGENLLNIALSHADRTRELMVRPDGSTPHAIEVNPSDGSLLATKTFQGKSAESTWSRGQAWAMYGFSYMYEATGERRYLDTAIKVAGYYLAHLPADHVPPADFDSTLAGLEFKDSSAAAVAACALLRLQRLTDDPALKKRYFDAAQATLGALTRPPYFSAGPDKAGLLVCAARNYHTDPNHWLTNTSLIFGDYYLLEALLEYRRTATGKPLQKRSVFARFVPERQDDFAWENDLVAFRAYGPALRSGPEDSGIDCWLKRTPDLIIDKWYAGALKGISYHEDHGEGYDPYHVGSSRGCGGTGLWKDNQLATSDTFLEWKIIEEAPDREVFELTYDYPASPSPVREVKRITIAKGIPFFESRSTFTRAGRPLAGLPVAIGVTTHDGKASVKLAPEKRWISCWEEIDGQGLGTGAILAPGNPLETHEIRSAEKDKGHALLITTTDPEGAVTAHCGYGWTAAGRIANREAWEATLTEFSNRLALKSP